MSKGITIAISGKGGVGKTNLSALLIRRLVKVGSVLAIDADPDSNLPQALGVMFSKSVGGVREHIVNLPARSPLGPGGKGEALELAMAEVLEEQDDFDMVVMGRSEGEGCYCAINHIIRQVIDSRGRSYDFTVVDCEPGLEHLSRRTTRDIDLMLVVTDATKNGVLTAKRVQELAKELHVSFGEVLVVANRITPEAKPLLDEMARESGLEIVAYIPYDPAIARFDMLGKPVTELPENSPAWVAVSELVDKLLERVEAMV